MHTRRPPAPLIGAIMLIVVAALALHSWPTIHGALLLLPRARPAYLALSGLVVGASFICAGQIYGRVLRMLGCRAPLPWLTGAAMVSSLLSQAIPAGTVASYTFLTASLRRRGIPPMSVALLAGLELASWVGGMLVFFGFGLLYLLLHGGGGLGRLGPPALLALTMAGGASFAATRPRVTLLSWTTILCRVLGWGLRRTWSQEQICRIVDSLIARRRMLAERPGQLLGLLALQVLVFGLHSLALLLLIQSLGGHPRPLAVVAAYGLALIVSTFTALPGGGGTVEAALALALSAEGLPPAVALGGAILFRLISFWLLLLPGAIVCRMLTAPEGPAGDP